MWAGSNIQFGITVLREEPNFLFNSHTKTLKTWFKIEGVKITDSTTMKLTHLQNMVHWTQPNWGSVTLNQGEAS